MNNAKKLKPISPTLKEKKRYLVFEVVSETKIEFTHLQEALKRAILEFLGQFTWAKAGIQILPRWNIEKQRGMIRIDNKYVDELKSALAFLKEINNHPVILKSVGVSGILNKAEERYM